MFCRYIEACDGRKAFTTLGHISQRERKRLKMMIKEDLNKTRYVADLLDYCFRLGMKKVTAIKK